MIRSSCVFCIFPFLFTALLSFFGIMFFGKRLLDEDKQFIENY